MEQAIRDGFRTDNPVTSIETRHQKGEGWRPWDPIELHWFAQLVDDPMLRAAWMLAIYTGQRQSDLLAMQWNQRRGGTIAVTQEKTGERVWIPEHPALTKVLDSLPKTAITIITSKKGRPVTADTFRNRWRLALMEIGLVAKDERSVTFHGLRANAAGALRELGVDKDDIKAITGHTTDAMVNHYARGARQTNRRQARHVANGTIRVRSPARRLVKVTSAILKSD